MLRESHLNSRDNTERRKLAQIFYVDIPSKFEKHKNRVDNERRAKKARWEIFITAPGFETVPKKGGSCWDRVEEWRKQDAFSEYCGRKGFCGRMKTLGNFKCIFDVKLGISNIKLARCRHKSWRKCSSMLLFTSLPPPFFLGDVEQ